MINNKKYSLAENYLPEFLKDFHDQKEVFKTIQQWACKENSFEELPNSEIDNQIYIIDYFLWCMALHGYKLQNIKSKEVKFLDINKIKDNLTQQKPPIFTNN